MGVDPPEATSVQPLGLNKMEDFIMFRDSGLWEVRQETEDLPPVPEVATRQLSDYKITKGWQSASSSRRRDCRRGLPLRRCSIHTEVSTRITRP